MVISCWLLHVMARLATTAQFTNIRVVCNNTLAIALRGQSSSAGVVKVPHSTKFDAEKVKQQLGISVRAWDEHMYEMKQLTQRKVSQTGSQQLILMPYSTTAPCQFPIRKKTSFSSIVMCATAKLQEKKPEPNGRAMTKAYGHV